ncbi:MAG: hypothetical protein ACI4JY_07045, partial [Oscillospiraceae bacterium]
MNGKQLLDKISDIDPRLIEDAEKISHKKNRLLIGIAPIAATAAAAALIAVVIGHSSTQKPP